MMDEGSERPQAQGLPHGGLFKGLANVRSAAFDPLETTRFHQFAYTQGWTTTLPG